ncbi:hypothetical protein BDF22DRAFT_664518 [Syncephalis plumigaleata]|nr:hypothetical protein BDF22DRAFT_664518 [Syncephalis plumigaleata]
MTLPVIGYRYLGVVPYRTALALQRAIVDYRLASRKQNDSNGVWDQDVLLLLQHSPVYTTGIRRFALRNTAEQDSDVEAERARLTTLGADYFQTRRGGQITFHGPGQLVGYPLVDINNYKFGVRQYVCALEKALIATCSHYGLNADASKETGVWIDNDKIAAIGIEIRRYITSHGFALNCNTDLDWYKHIIPCGLVDRGVTSITRALEERQQQNQTTMHRTITVSDTIPVVVNAIANQFQCDIESLERINPVLARNIDQLIIEHR